MNARNYLRFRNAHPLGKGEVRSSILRGSTIFSNDLATPKEPAPLVNCNPALSAACARIEREMPEVIRKVREQKR